MLAYYPIRFGNHWPQSHKAPHHIYLLHTTCTGATPTLSPQKKKINLQFMALDGEQDVAFHSLIRLPTGVKNEAEHINHRSGTKQSARLRMRHE